MQFYSNYSTFYQMCDTIEGVRAVSLNKTNNATGAAVPSADGVGVEKALANFAAWFKAEYLPGCAVSSPIFLGTDCSVFYCN